MTVMLKGCKAVALTGIRVIVPALPSWESLREQ